ncbi:MAG: HAD family phosphatase [Anaerolineae bacterium]|nr:HAD family phosphatase [Anaerolineae bacterium]
MSIKGVIFDLCGVLITGGLESSLTLLCEETGQNELTVGAAYTRRERDFDLGLIDSCEFWKGFCAELKVPCDPVKLDSIVVNAYAWQPGMKALIRELSSKFVLTLLTNHRRVWFERIDSNLGISPYFDHIIISSDVHLVKPDTEIFKIAIAKNNSPAGDLLFIDDKEENLTAAHSMGLMSARFVEATKVREMILQMGSEKQKSNKSNQTTNRGDPEWPST